MKTKINSLVTVLVFAASAWGCTHVVSADYPQYLANNKGRFPFPQTQLDAEYYITPETMSHHYPFRSAMVGGANLWVVKFGIMLEQSIQSEDVQAAFNKLTNAESEDSPAKLMLKFHLVHYEFAGFEARIGLQISALKNGTEFLNKKYFQKGKSQGGKMFWAGAFAMKNAIQQSTKNCIDIILLDLLKELQKQS